MADRVFYPVQALNPQMKIIAGSFLPNGSSAVASATTTGQGYTVARTSTGLFTITLTDKYNSLLSGQVSLALNAVAQTVVQFGAIDVSSAKTITINAVTSGSAADIASNANNRIHFLLILSNTNVVT